MEKICIIKLGALGDVIRTTPILNAIKKKYKNSNITWITKRESREVLEGLNQIDKILTIPIEHNLNEFDLLYNFDIDELAIELASKINAKEKLGFYSIDGFPAAFNSGAEYYLETIFNDDLKKSNKKTYQEMIFEVAELPYKKQTCLISLNERDEKYGKNYLKKQGLDLDKKNKLIGIHMGASPRWPSKTWDIEKIKQFIIKLYTAKYDVILFGGPNEKDSHRKLISELEKINIKVYTNDVNNSIKEFASLVKLCSKIICGDTMALHLALALNKEVIGLFFCTSPYEIEGYGRLTKLVSPKLYDFFPERMNEYDKDLVNSISVEEVLKKI